MKTLLCSIVLGLFFQLFAQGTQESPKAFAPEQNALIFSIGSNFTLANFEEASVAYKRKLDNYSAIRVTVSIGGNVNEDVTDNSYYYDSTHRTQNQKNDIGGFSLGINPVYLRYHAAKNNVYFFYGAGPHIGFGNNKLSQNAEETASFVHTYKKETTTDYYYFGASLLCGVEWFPTESISFHAEYGVMLRYTKRETETTTTSAYSSIESISKDNYTSKDIVFSAKNVSFGLSVYF